MGKALTLLRVIMILLSLGVSALPIAAAYSATQIQYNILPTQFLVQPEVQDGVVTTNFTVFVSNYGLFDINSILILTDVLDESFSSYQTVTPRLVSIPRNTFMPLTLTMRVNLTALNQTGRIEEFLNNMYFLGRAYLFISYVYNLIGLAIPLVTSIGTMSPMFNLTVGPAVRDYTTNQTANTTLVFANLIKGYTLTVNATLTNGTSRKLSVIDSFNVPSLMTSGQPFIGNITFNNSPNIITGGSGYTLVLRFTSPFGYTFTNTSYVVI
ncbi:MAG: hypothetical protein ACTSUQ_07585 [Candidatus Freyarchaeota archaeon]